jgi:hypothetical protein
MIIWVLPFGRCVLSPPNTFDRTAGSHSLAAAVQRARWADQRRVMPP